ncbi:glycoside hydrolase family 172 protein [Pseudokineococcus sp. 5B2Z-1]|uniref:glycoside hydrolase family 172 protein n=1 Tax=Pseudokineococcus sp. 5B2Z-1 TaxID=3132744 RepID=UPI0030A14E6E
MTTAHGGYGDFGSSLRDLPRLRTSRRRRASSWDRTGGNDDRVTVRPGETVTLADIAGAGSIHHIWMTVAPAGFDAGTDADHLRRLVLRITWDGAEHPSVLVPLGDFFGVGHARTTNFVSAPLQMSPQDGKGFNSWFHMPFSDGARVELLSECEQRDMWVYYYVDYDELDHLEEGLGRFHAQFRRVNPTPGISEDGLSNDEFQFGGTNLTGAENYTVLEASGRGHYVGCVLSITNLRETDEGNWYGEGDDMIFVDDEPFPPSLHGTGTEDYVNTAWCPSEPYSAPYHGITLPGGPNWAGQVSVYRFHVEDPVPFTRSIRVSIEHGHANRRSDDLSSVAYWYQELPHAPFGIPPVAERLP